MHRVNINIKRVVFFMTDDLQQKQRHNIQYVGEMSQGLNGRKND